MNVFFALKGSKLFIIIYLYECTQRNFTCKFCIDVDDEFSENFQASQNSFNLTEARTPEFNNCGLDDQHQTATLIHTATGTSNANRSEISSNRSIIIRAIDRKSVECQADFEYHLSNKESKSTTCQTNSQPVRTVEKKSTSSQTDKCFQLDDLQELNKSTVFTLQDSFVGAFEKINESVRSLKSNIDNENHWNQRINVLLKENEKLRGI